MASFYSNDFWGRVRQRMLDLGMTMKDLSRLADVPYGSIYRQIAQDMVPPKREQVERMANVLGCTSDYLLTGQKAEQNTLSPEMAEHLSLYKMLKREQKDVVDALIRQMAKDNADYASLYIDLNGTDPDRQ